MEPAQAGCCSYHPQHWPRAFPYCSGIHGNHGLFVHVDVHYGNAIMMFPIALAIITQMETTFSCEETHKFSVGLLLRIAYAALAKGLATLVGTPPNPALVRIFEITFPNAEPIAFGAYFIMALPLSLVMLAIIRLSLVKVIYRVPPPITIEKSIVEKSYRRLGPVSFEERAALTVFALTALFWIFRNGVWRSTEPA